jgi:hypothetical protein
MKMLATVCAGIMSGVAGVRVAAMVFAGVTFCVGAISLLRPAAPSPEAMDAPVPLARARITS